MGIENRDYYRKAHNYRALADWGIYSITPAVKFIIITNVVVFLLQVFVVREVRVAPLDMMRKQNPELDRMLAEAGDDPQALEALRRKNQGLDRLLDANDMDNAFVPPQRISLIQEWFELDPSKVLYQGQVWRLLTHAFCHERQGLFHILFNMLFLYWFGCTLEGMYGEREFLLFYLAAAARRVRGHGVCRSGIRHRFNPSWNRSVGGRDGGGHAVCFALPA